MGSRPYHPPAWFIERHGSTTIFEVNYQYIYILLFSSGKPEKQEVEKLSKEYAGKNSTRLFFKALKAKRDCEPDSIFVNVIRSQENGCEIEVECLPTLYRKISQTDIDRTEEIPEHRIQDAYISCERFLRTVFLGGLSGTLITEKKIIPAKPKVQFLINDASNRQITEKIAEMMADATGEILIFGWMGTILLKNLLELKQKGIEIKIITGNVIGIRQDPMRKEKERAMKELISFVGKDHISINPEFHGRAMVVDNKALVGSMDLDSYSLTGTRIEFATYTEDPETVRSLRSYFNRIFKPMKEEEEQKS